MVDLPRDKVTFPIKLFTNVTGGEITDALNELINDVNAVISGVVLGATLNSYTVANLGTAPTNQIVMATNGRKIGEGAGLGTGVPVYFSLGAWRVFSTDAPVQS